MRTPRWRSDLISRGIHLLEVHEGFGEMIAGMGHFDKVRIGSLYLSIIVSSLYVMIADMGHFDKVRIGYSIITLCYLMIL